MILAFLKGRKMSRVFVQKYVSQRLAVKSFEVHTQECYFIKNVDLPEFVIEFDTIEKHGVSVKKNIAGMKVAVDIPFHPLINALLHPVIVDAEKGITPFNRAIDDVAELNANAVRSGHNNRSNIIECIASFINVEWSEFPFCLTMEGSGLIRQPSD